MTSNTDDVFKGIVTECIVVFMINAFTIFAFSRKRHLRKRTTYLIINLTVADLLVGAVAGPLGTYFRNMEIGHGFSWREFIILIFISIFPLASQANLSLIALERLHATLYPFRHCLVGKWVYFKIIIGSWLVVLLLSSVMAFLYLCIKEAIPYAWASHIVITLLIITTSYLIINFNVKSNPLRHHSGSVVSERKLSLTLLIATVVSIMTILPEAVWALIRNDVLDQLSQETGLASIDLSAVVLYYASSIVNPLIYAIRMRHFRKTVKEPICKAS